MTLIDISGPVTLGTATSDMRGAITAVLDEGAKRIVLNLTGVNYMDSAGIGELVNGLRMARSRGASLKLMNLSPRVQELLTITKVITLFEHLRDEASAISSFS